MKKITNYSLFIYYFENEVFRKFLYDFHFPEAKHGPSLTLSFSLKFFLKSRCEIIKLIIRSVILARQLFFYPD